MDKRRIGIPFSHIKRILKICAALWGIWLIVRALNYIYVDEDVWYRILWHHYYEDEGKIDNIYLGSSHVYCDINPVQMDSENNQYNFNLATPNQRLNGSYYLLKEADRNNELSHVYLELYYSCSTKDNFSDDTDPITDEEYNWPNPDYMRNSINKLEYMLSIGEPEDYTDIFFPFSRYRANLDNWDYVRRTVEKKKKESYQAYEHHGDWEDGNGYDEFLGQGRFVSTREFQDEARLFAQSRILGENSLGERSEGYIRKIISYCQKRNIPITLFVSPMNELEVVSTENYDSYVNQIRDIAEEYEIDFYDFNLAREEYLPIQEGRYFRDAWHLNNAGACLFTPFFYDIVSGNKADNEKYFYASYEEKLRETEPAVYGLYYRDSEITEKNPEQIRTFHIASNRDAEMEYQIEIAPNEGEQYILQSFSINKIFTLPVSEHGSCTIISRMADDRKYVVQTMKINF